MGVGGGVRGEGGGEGARCVIKQAVERKSPLMTTALKDLTLKAARHWVVNLILRRARNSDAFSPDDLHARVRYTEHSAVSSAGSCHTLTGDPRTGEGHALLNASLSGATTFSTAMPVHSFTLSDQLFCCE